MRQYASVPLLMFFPFRKPRINPQLVAQQVAQQFAPPAPPKKEKIGNPAKKGKLHPSAGRKSNRSVLQSLSKPQC